MPELVRHLVAGLAAGFGAVVGAACALVLFGLVGAKLLGGVPRGKHGG